MPNGITAAKSLGPKDGLLPPQSTKRDPRPSCAKSAGASPELLSRVHTSSNSLPLFTEGKAGPECRRDAISAQKPPLLSPNAMTAFLLRKYVSIFQPF